VAFRWCRTIPATTTPTAANQITMPAVRILQDTGSSELKGSKILFAGAEARGETPGRMSPWLVMA
jgi:hypothetical protein